MFLKTDGAGNLSFSSDLPTTSFTGATAETSIAGSDLVLIYDDSATAVRKMTRTNFVSGIGGSNTPSFRAYRSANYSIASSSFVEVQFDTKTFDTNTCFNTSTYRFTPTSSGYYFFNAQITYAGAWSNRIMCIIRQNGTDIHRMFILNGDNTGAQTSAIINMNGTTDYVSVWTYHENASSQSIDANSARTWFMGFKLI